MLALSDIQSAQDELQEYYAQLEAQHVCPNCDMNAFEWTLLSGWSSASRPATLETPPA